MSGGLPPFTTRGDGWMRDPGDPGHALFALDGLAAALRRRWWLVAIGVLVSVAVAVGWTLWVVPMYEATATLRFDEAWVNVPRMVQPISTENRIGTELLAIQQRSASVAIIESLGLRAEVTSPRGGRITELFRFLKVGEAADTGTIVLRRDARGTVTASFEAGGHPPIVANVRDTIRFGGVTVLVNPDTWSSDEVRIRVVTLDQAVRRFESRRTVVRPARDADLISIRVRDPDPARSAAAANLLAERVMEVRQAGQRYRTATAIEELRDQLAGLEWQLREAEERLRDVRVQAGVVDPNESARTQVARLVQAEAERGALEVERQALAALLAGAPGVGDAVEGDATLMYRDLIAFPTLFRNQAASELLGALARMENERAALLTRRGTDDPDVRVLSARIVELDRQLRAIAQTYLLGLDHQIASFDEVIAGFASQLDSLPETQVQLARIERDVRVKEELYTSLQARLQEAEITQAMEDPTVRVADPAVSPDRPVRPRPVVNMVLGLSFGIMVGMVAAVVRELTDRSIRSRADATAASGLPVLGVIPRSRRRAGKVRHSQREEAGRPIPAPANAEPLPAGPGVPSRPLFRRAAVRALLVTDPNARVDLVEAFNQLHVNLAARRPHEAAKITVITSPLAGEGKTLTTVNLGLTLARLGKRILLIDGDLRCGQLHEIFATSRSPGLAEVVAGEAGFRDAMRPIRVPGTGHLFLVPAGAAVSAPGRSLTTEWLRSRLGAITDPFDIVLVDTPPVNLLADAAMFASVADAVLLVIRAGRSRMADVTHAVDQLTAVRAPLIGTLLTDVDPERQRYDDDSYRYFKEVSRYVASHRARDPVLS